MSKLRILAVMVCLAAGVSYNAFSQTPPVSRKPLPVAKPEPPLLPELPPLPAGRDTIEKAIAVDANVSVQLPCINEARVTVNGWKRNELRIFIRNGTGVGFKVHEKDPKSGKPNWVVVRGGRGAASPMPECISGERIDIEVPVGAYLSIKGRETEIAIDTVKKVEIKNLGGKVSLRNISGGIDAQTFEGDVAVENSSGQISLVTSSGNIIAAEVGPGEVGDVFKARTSAGAITLQSVDHRQIEANSVSGQVVFRGKFLSGGIYSFKTSDGAMRFVIPKEASCRVVAWYGYGAIDSEIPMKVLTRDVYEGGKSLRATIGDGDATLNLTTNRGRIMIQKDPKVPDLP
ncbi:MAG: DUF4097 domain-containing protein [Pyrinomonadaceae bacterium]